MRIVLLSVREKLVGKLVRHRTDNMKAEHILHPIHFIQKASLLKYYVDSIRFVWSLNGSLKNSTRRLMSSPGWLLRMTTW